MQLSLNNITYGNPNYNQKKALLEICLVDSLFPKLKNFPFPENESDSTKQELNEIVGYLKDIELPENIKFRNRYLFYDKNLFQAIKNTFITEKIIFFSGVYRFFCFFSKPGKCSIKFRN